METNNIKEVLKQLSDQCEKTYLIEYQGKGVSLNQYYSQNDWRVRNSIKKKYRKLAKEIIDGVIPEDEHLAKFGLVIYYWSKHDPDNVAGFEKIIIDGLKEGGYIDDDSRNQYKFFCIVPDETLDHNTFNFHLMKIK